MKKSLAFALVFISVSLGVLAQETASSTPPPAQPEFIKGTERYFFQIGSLNTVQTDTIRNMYKNQNLNFVIGVESVISRFTSIRFALGYAGWNVNKSRVSQLYKDSVAFGKTIDVSPSHKMQVISINPDMKFYYPGSTRQFSGYATVGVTGYFTIQRAIVKISDLTNDDQSLTPIASLNANIGLGCEYHLNELLMVYAEAKYGREFFNFSVPNNNKWVNTTIALGVAVKFGNE
jgi:hypothetical protein